MELDTFNHEAGIGKNRKVGVAAARLDEAVDGVESGGDGPLLPAGKAGQLVADDEEDGIFFGGRSSRGTAGAVDGGALMEMVEVFHGLGPGLADGVPISPAAFDIGNVLPGDGDAVFEFVGEVLIMDFGSTLFRFLEALFDWF